MTKKELSFFQQTNTIPNQDLMNAILSGALQSADPYRLVNHHILLANGNVCIGNRKINSSKKIILISMGKASLAMAESVMDKIGAQIQRGVVVCKSIPEKNPDWQNIHIIQGAHPIPDECSQAAGELIQECLQGLTITDLVLVLISGGASALVASPVCELTLEELQTTNQLLLRSGATINEVNAVRKHLEQLKGGGLLRAAAPASVEAFLLSDVIGNDSSVIASGPTVADLTTYAEALEILENYHITGQVPAAVLAHLQAGVAGEFPETIKPGDDLLKRVNNQIIGSNDLAIKAALQEAQTLGIKNVCVSRQMVGEASQAAQWFLDESRKAAAQNPGSLVVIAGGETTVTVHGDGKGGRNLELALAAVRGMENDEHGTLITLATDGEDGPTDAAGAVVTAGTMKRAKKLGLNPETFLQNNDAYTFFEQAGGLIRIGSTGTNVNDLTFYFNFP